MNNRAGNNFDLIRLLAACQVMASHLLHHFGADTGPIAKAVALFPGVPVFFVVSGYLIADSWARRPDAVDFARRRFLRIFPGMWGALAFSAVAVALLHSMPAGTFILWIAAQATVGQNWHPDALRGFGVGVLNGSLWSICVEIALYAAVPIIAAWKSRNLALVAAISFAALYLITDGLAGFWLKLAYVSPIGWAGMFIVGMLAHRAQWKPSVTVGAALFLSVALLSILWPSAPHALLRATGNDLGVLNFLGIAALTLAIAFARPVTVSRDVSYGVFLYHMPVLNVALALGLTGAAGIAATAGVTVAVALAGFALIERPLRNFAVRQQRRAPEVGASDDARQVGSGGRRSGLLHANDLRAVDGDAVRPGDRLAVEGRYRSEHVAVD